MKTHLWKILHGLSEQTLKDSLLYYHLIVARQYYRLYLYYRHSILQVYLTVLEHYNYRQVKMQWKNLQHYGITTVIYFQVASRVLKIPMDQIYIAETSTNTIPNASFTAGSMGCETVAPAVKVR